MLSSETVESLLEAAAGSEDPQVRLSALRALSRLPMSRESWEQAAGRIDELIDVLPTSAEVADILARLPVAAARTRLEQIALEEAHPGRAVALHALAVGDPTAHRGLVDLLLSRLAAEPTEPTVEALAALPIEQYAVAPDAFDAAVAHPDIAVRLWAGVAVGRLGALQPITDVVFALDGGESPEWMWGDPWTAYDRLAVVRPVPWPLAAHLLALLREDLRRDPSLLIWAVTGVADAEGTPSADPTMAPDLVVIPAGDEADARAVAARLIEAPLTPDCRLRADRGELAALAALPPDVAAEVVACFAEHVHVLDRPELAMVAGNHLLDVVLALPDDLPLPVERMLSAHLGADEPRLPPQQLAWTLAQGSAEAAVEALVPYLSNDDERVRAEASELLDGLAHYSETGTVPYLGVGRSGGSSRRTMAEPAPEAAPIEAHPPREDEAPRVRTRSLPPLDAAPPADREGWADAVREEAPDTTGDGSDEPETAAPDSHEATAPDAAPRTAWPLVSCDPVVVVGRPFELAVGLAPTKDPALDGTGVMTIAPTRTEDVEVEVQLSYDPAAFALVTGQPRTRLTVTPADPYPVARVQLVALAGEQLGDRRRLGASYFAGGAMVGFASREVMVAATDAAAAQTTPPAQGEPEGIDLTGLLGEEPPDLLLVARYGDDSGDSRLVWTMHSAVPGVQVPGDSFDSDVGQNPAAFARANQLKVRGTTDQFDLFIWMTGRGREVASAMPQEVRDALVAVIAARSPEPATVLLLSEEPYVPWELAVLDLPGAGPDRSPFLGAQVAIGRWLLSTTKPAARPPRQVDVHAQAVLTATYDAVPNWARLVSAEEEGVALVAAWTPAHAIKPFFRDVISCLEGNPPAEVLHFALHGQFDPQGVEEGLVLLAPDPAAAGEFIARFLQPDHVRAVSLGRRPFVFLNACQVGLSKEVLGDYAGMAAAFLFAGASGVVAPLWNVDDTVATGIALDFYRSAYADQPVPVAEILRRVRAQFTRAAVDSGAAGVSATHVSYQFFGHPRLLLRRSAPVPTEPVHV